MFRSTWLKTLRRQLNPTTTGGRRRLRQLGRFRPRLNELDCRAVPAASLSIGDASVAEGNSGTVNMNFTVTRTGDLGTQVTVSYTTADGTAVAGIDYLARSGNLVIPSGAASATISVPVIGNLVHQPNRTFSLQLTGVVDAFTPASFASQQSFGTGNSPWSLAAGDLNGDGKPDLAVASTFSDAVSVFLNTTSPGAAMASFASRQDFGTGSRPIAVAIGDLNGDGRPDLVVANSFSNSVSVFLNTTAPGATTASFIPRRDFGTGSYPFSVAVRDLSGDGRQDLAVANSDSNTVSVLLNTTAAGAATASFASRQDFGTGNDPFSLAAGDINGDGKADLAVTNINSDTVSVLLNTTVVGAATPSFAPKQDFQTETDPVSAAVGDLNGDGKLDLAIANLNSQSVSVLLNTTVVGAATVNFATRQDFTTGFGPESLGVVDLNGDDKLDLAVASNASDSVSALLNTTAAGAATASFASRQDFATQSGPISLAVGDLNGDGKSDLAVANLGSNSVSVLINTVALEVAPASFAIPQSFDTELRPRSVAVGDFNGDGKPDLAGPNLFSYSVSVLRNTTPPGAAAPTFAPRQDFATGSFPNSVVVGDLNGDGRPDLAVANYTANTVSVLLNTTAPGAATFTFAPRQDFATGTRPTSVALGDLNGDGKPDLVIANSNADTVSVLLNTTAPGAATPAFAPRQAFASGAGPAIVAVGDLNGDGKPDLAVNNFNADAVSVLLNTTAPGAATPTFAPGQFFAAGNEPYSVAVGNFNGDGKPDLAVGHRYSNTVSVLLNTTAPGASTPTFAANVDSSVGNVPLFVSVSDLNGDGKADLVTANYNVHTVSVLLNTTAPGASTPTFAARQDFASGFNPRQVAVSDFNGDCKPDLAVANFTANTVSVLLNTAAPLATITDATAIGTILDDDVPPPSVTMGLFGNPLAEAGGVATVTATLSAVASQAVTVNLGFTGTAGHPADYSRSATSITIPAGSLSGSVTLTAVQDSLDEPNETIVVDITTVTNGNENGVQQVTAAIIDDDPPPSVQFNLVSQGAFESVGTMAVTVTLSAVSGHAVTIPYTLGGTATGGGVDYSLAPGLLVIPAGAASGTLTIAVVSDTLPEPDETVVITLGTPTNATLGIASTHTATIFNDDPPHVASVVVNGGAAQRSRVTDLTISFDSAVALPANPADAFRLSRIGGGFVGSFTASASIVGGVTVVTLSNFMGAETRFGSLADGIFSLTVVASQVTLGGQQLDGDGNGVPGGDYVLTGAATNRLFALYGDANGDGVVNASDTGPFRSAFGASSGDSAYRDWLDYDGNGTINAFDFGQFRSRFGVNLFP